MKSQTADLIRNGSPNLSDEFFVQPEPSLCDSCKNTYFVNGHTVTVDNKDFHQRYCMTKKINISTNGFEDCISHNPL